MLLSVIELSLFFVIFVIALFHFRSLRGVARSKYHKKPTSTRASGHSVTGFDFCVLSLFL